MRQAMDKFHRLVLEKVAECNRGVQTYVIANGLLLDHANDLLLAHRSSLTPMVLRACKKLTLDGLLTARSPRFRGEKREFALTDIGRELVNGDATECLWCGKVIRHGDACERGGGMSDGEIACEECASTLGDMLAEPGSFIIDDSGEETVYHTAETAREFVDKRLAEGGKLTDKLVEPY